MPTPPSKPATLAVARRLLRGCAQNEGFTVACGLLLILLGSAVALLQPWPLKIIIDSALNSNPAPFGLDSHSRRFYASDPQFALLLFMCVAYLTIHICSAILTLGSTWLLVGVGLRMVLKLRCKLFDHIQRLSLRFHDSQPRGDLLYRITWDAYAAQAIFNSALIPAFTSILTLIGIAAFMLSRDWTVGAIALIVAVPLVWLVKRMDRPMSEHSMALHERESDIASRVDETLTGIRAVKAFGREQHESARFSAHAADSFRANIRLTLLQVASQSIVGLLLAAGTAIVIYFASVRVMQHRLSPGDVVLLASYVAMLLKPLETLAYIATGVQSAAAGAQRVLFILDNPAEVIDAPTSSAPSTPAGHSGEQRNERRVSNILTLSNVSFSYAPGRLALHNVSLDIPAGKTIALVGPSGAGKTTLASLLMRFYDPDEGTIFLADADIRKLRLRDLRDQFALVLQDPILFSTSVSENIGYGRPGASAADIERAARRAGAHDFIMQLPRGYDTSIGQHGAALSAGQRQRISIARAFLRDAPILILDEPTSALDARTEADLLAALAELQRGRTTIIIAHRLSTIRHADRIIVLDAGAIVESGTHEQLLARAGLYARLHSTQCGTESNTKARSHEGAPG